MLEHLDVRRVPEQCRVPLVAKALDVVALGADDDEREAAPVERSDDEPTDPARADDDGVRAEGGSSLSGSDDERGGAGADHRRETRPDRDAPGQRIDRGEQERVQR